MKKEIGYIWLDAHGDMNTPDSSPSGNVHGMPLAAIMGYGADELVNLGGFKPKAEPGNIVIVGARDLDAQERKIVKKSGIHVFTMRDIDERGMRDVMSEALKYAMDDTAGVAGLFGRGDRSGASAAPGRDGAAAYQRWVFDRCREAQGHRPAVVAGGGRG